MSRTILGVVNEATGGGGGGGGEGGDGGKAMVINGHFIQLWL